MLRSRKTFWWAVLFVLFFGIFFESEQPGPSWRDQRGS